MIMKSTRVMKMKPIDVRFSDEVMTRVKALAVDTDETASAIAREAMDLGLSIMESNWVTVTEGDAESQLDMLGG
jgi:predicted DNA-binding protein